MSELFYIANNPFSETRDEGERYCPTIFQGSRNQAMDIFIGRHLTVPGGDPKPRLVEHELSLIRSFLEGRVNNVYLTRVKTIDLDGGRIDWMLVSHHLRKVELA